MYNDFDDDEIIKKYLNDDKTKTDELFDKINRTPGTAKHSGTAARTASRTSSASAPRTVQRTTSAPKAVTASKSTQNAPVRHPSKPVAHTLAKEDPNSAITAPIPEEVQAAPVMARAAAPETDDKDKRRSFEALKAEEAAKKEKKKKIKNILIKTGLAVGCFVLVLGIGVFALFKHYFGDLKIESIDEESLHVNSELESKIKEDPVLSKITNIALFGVDARPGEEKSRSDAIIIASINPKKGSIKLISVMRDSYVTIDGDWDKINHAYFYGGPELAIATLNENFDLNITDYVTVDFSSLADAIDAVGGVYIDVDYDEMYNINLNCRELNPYFEDLTETGNLFLTGEQAVGYARIRRIDGDQGRTSRQREVIMAMVNELKKKNFAELPGIAKEIIPMVSTSMTYDEIMAFLPMMSKDITMQQTMIPGDYDGAYDATIDGAYYMVYDLDSATKHIYDFIYNDIDPNTPPAEEGTE